MSVADKVSFYNFCQLCTKLSEASYDKKLTVLENYIEDWKKKAEELEKAYPKMNNSFYPVLRLLLPQLDRERGAYGVKEHSLAKIYIRILSLPRGGNDATKFLEFRGAKCGSGANDFAEVAYWILKKRCADGCKLSIEEVNNYLDTIATKHATNESRAVDDELISLLKETSAEEQKWLIRIILKDMKLGVGHNAILKCFHSDAKELYEASNNLRKVADMLKDPKTRLNEVEVEIFSPLKPMLSEECNFQKLDVYLKRCRYFYVETKLDGERFQLHKNEENYKYFSRNGFDYSSKFGPTRFDGVLTPKIAHRFHPDVKSCILDGEMMIWNSVTGIFESKAVNIDVKSLRKNDAHQPCFCVFDVLFYNGQILTNKPLNYRLEILEKILNPLNGAICFISRRRISSKEEVVESLNEAIDNREEGIIIKEFTSVYKPNVRNNGGWYKVKPEYVDGLSDTLDLLILGGYFGSGRHKGNISHFLLGVAASVEDDSPLFYSFARVGSGYSLSELSELQKKIKQSCKPVKIGEMPPGIEWTQEKPDVWIPPNKSFVLEIKAAEITSSHSYKTECTLRFPRVKTIRYDKSWKDCLTLEELDEKVKMASGKLISRHLNFLESESAELKKKCPRSNINLGHQFKSVDFNQVECVSHLLADKEICVFTGFGNVQKKDIECKIVEFGGTVVQNPGKNTFCILAETDSTTRIKNVMKSDLYDLVKTSWFYSLLNTETNYLPQFKPKDFLAVSSKTRKMLEQSYDEFGDHYTIPVTVDSILPLLESTKRKCKNINLSIEEKFEMDVELFSGHSPYSLFRLCNAYFDPSMLTEKYCQEVMPPLKIFELDFKFFGGRCTECIRDETTHVIVYSGDLSRLEEYNRENVVRVKKFHIVTEKWISDSIKNNVLSEDAGF